ncbi:C-GCAxxG-C-C family (seleno)protein [Desulfosporosinus sp. FKA]|uniref:C-GCAxxG-C-C family (seleno)protein n=1 Tax=Desulfosporosinus sp. FKA TaxID=1969834 RepID=UPI000B49841D|nr:C-GCAxxG-C-C family (seleno)protein [Desulfosporosinus sp. FKA]
MNDDVVLEARSRAGNKFKEGFNCSESILHAFNELLNNPLSSESLKMATGFGGGLGYAGCMCGALTSSVMVLGLYQGRITHQQDREPLYNLAHEFHDRFSDQFGGTCCRVLNPHDFDSPEHLKHCLKLTGGTAKLLMEFILEKKLTLAEK